jgi:hypothetical protein
MKNIVIALCCLIILPALVAQEKTGNITGRVLDEEKNPLPGVEVTLTGPQMAPLTTVTTEVGIFRFVSILPGNDYMVKAKLLGFVTKTQTGVVVNAGKSSDITITMEVGKLEEQVTVVLANKVMYVAPFIRGVQVSVTGKDGLTPLHKAASEESKDEADRLIAAGADVNTKTADGWTPLHIAAHSGSLDVT